MKTNSWSAYARKTRIRVLSLLTIPLCFAATLDCRAEIGYPWSMGMSTTSAESDGEKLSFSIQQGLEVDVGERGWSVSPFIGLNYDRSNIPIQSWNNVTKPRMGIELSNQFNYGPINWGEIRLGIQKQRYHYRDGKTDFRETSRQEAYMRMYMNGNWAN